MMSCKNNNDSDGGIVDRFVQYKKKVKSENAAANIPFIQVSYFEGGMRYLMFNSKDQGVGLAVINVTRDSINAESIKRDLLDHPRNFDFVKKDQNMPIVSTRGLTSLPFNEISFFEGGMRYVMYYQPLEFGRYNSYRGNITVINITLDSLNTLKYSL